MKTKNETSAPIALHAIAQPLVDRIWRERCDLLSTLRMVASCAGNMSGMAPLDRDTILTAIARAEGR